jgi:hypothetical protein
MTHVGSTTIRDRCNLEHRYITVIHCTFWMKSPGAEQKSTMGGHSSSRAFFFIPCSVDCTDPDDDALEKVHITFSRPHPQ